MCAFSPSPIHFLSAQDQSRYMNAHIHLRVLPQAPEIRWEIAFSASSGSPLMARWSHALQGVQSPALESG